MSDHDASPKEWTHAHSLRHGPQRWLSKLQRKQIKAQQAYIAAITAKEAAAAAAATSPPQFGSSSPSAACGSASSSSRRSSTLPPLESPPHIDVSVASLSPSPLLDESADDGVAPVPASIDEGGESDEEDSDDEAERQPQRSHRSRAAPRLRHSVAATDVTHILPDGSFAFRDNFRRQSSAPLTRSWSDADGSGSGSDGGGAGGWAPSEMQHACTCPACEIAAAHQLAAQSFYMQSLQHVHSSIVSPAHRHTAIERSATFSAGSAFTPHARASAAASASARPYSTHARTQSAHVQMLSPSLHIAPSFDETAMRLRGESPAAAAGSPSQPLADSSVFTSPVVVSPADSVRPPPPAAQKPRQSLLSSQTGVAQPVVAAAAPAAAPFVAPVPAAPSLVPPAPAPSLSTVSLLPRWFLIILAILRETDGRDKLAKCVQYGARTFAILLRQLPAAIWWIGFASKHAREGRFAPIGRAINILLCSHAPNAAAVAAATAATAVSAAAAEPALQLLSSSSSPGSSASAASSSAPLVGRSNFSAALRSSYLADTSVFRARLETNPLYNGALSRIAVLSAALSSGRRVIRLLKWTYTLPTWAKTFASWKAQVRASLEKDARPHDDHDHDHDHHDDDDREGAAEDAEKNAPVDSSSSSSSPSPRGFRFSHPHPPHLWRRLPWLSSVELLDLSIAVATDMSDDLEWLSKYRLFPAAWGYRCGRIAVCLWLTTVVLDLLLTFRILRHYHYQQRQLQRQIDEAQMDFATVARQLNMRQEERQDKELRRAQRRKLQHSPLFKRIQSHQPHQSASDSLVLVQSDATSAAVSNPLAASSVSDASWSELLSSDGSVRVHSSNSEGSSARSSQSHASAEEEQQQQQRSDSGASSLATDQDEHAVATTADAQGRGHAQAVAAAAAAATAAEQKPGGRVTTHAEESADCVHSDDDDADDADGVGVDSDVDLLQSASVEAYRRVSELRSQSGAIRVSLFLQYLNFAKFSFDLGCAAPMAWNVAKDHDSMIQTTGLMSGLLGVYKLFLTAKPAQ